MDLQPCWPGQGGCTLHSSQLHFPTMLIYNLGYKKGSIFPHRFKQKQKQKKATLGSITSMRLDKLFSSLCLCPFPAVHSSCGHGDMQLYSLDNFCHSCTTAMHF